MNSETSTDHGEASGARHGRSRACSAYHSRTGRCSALIASILRRPSNPVRRGYPRRRLAAFYRARHACEHARTLAVRGLLASPAGGAQRRAGGLPRRRQGARQRQRRLLRRQGRAGRCHHARPARPRPCRPATRPRRAGRAARAARAGRAGRAARPRPRHPRRRPHLRRCCPTRAARAPTTTSTSPPTVAAPIGGSDITFHAQPADPGERGLHLAGLARHRGHEDHLRPRPHLVEQGVPRRDPGPGRRGTARLGHPGARGVELPALGRGVQRPHRMGAAGLLPREDRPAGRRGDRRPVRAAGSGTADRDPDRDARVTCRQSATATATATATAGTDRHRVSLEAWRSYLRATRASSWTDPPRGSDRTRITIAPLCRGVYWSRTT